MVVHNSKVGDQLTTLGNVEQFQSITILSNINVSMPY